MISLCGSQVSFYERILSQLENAWESGHSILLIGPPGKGKRTIVRRFGESLGLDFVEIHLTGSVMSINNQIFGSVLEASRAHTDGPPGEAGKPNSLLYLAGLQSMDESLAHEIFRLVRHRNYVDGNGVKWKVADDTLIVASITLPSVTITQDHS